MASKNIFSLLEDVEQEDEHQQVAEVQKPQKTDKKKEVKPAQVHSQSKPVESNGK